MNWFRKAAGKMKAWYARQDRWQRTGVWIMVLLAVLAVAALAAGICIWRGRQHLPPPPAPPETSSGTEAAAMPPVVGMEAGAARALLTPLTEHVRLERVNGAEILFTAGFTVSAQDPLPGTPVTPDTVVTLVCLSQEELQAETGTAAAGS